MIDTYVLEQPTVQLTPREREVLELVGCGYAAVRVGRILGISERTVHKHLENSYVKLGVHDRLSAYHRMLRLGLITLD